MMSLKQRPSVRYSDGLCCWFIFRISCAFMVWIW